MFSLNFMLPAFAVLFLIKFYDTGSSYTKSHSGYVLPCYECPLNGRAFPNYVEPMINRVDSAAPLVVRPFPAAAGSISERLFFVSELAWAGGVD
jgi:hypothetical protein